MAIAASVCIQYTSENREWSSEQINLAVSSQILLRDWSCSGIAISGIKFIEYSGLILTYQVLGFAWLFDTVLFCCWVSSFLLEHWLRMCSDLCFKLDLNLSCCGSIMVFSISFGWSMLIPWFLEHRRRKFAALNMHAFHSFYSFYMFSILSLCRLCITNVLQAMLQQPVL